MAIKRLGIFGGTFNPIHLGHLIIAQESIYQFQLDKIIFVPSAIPPHKAIPDIASGKHRFNMTRLAIVGNRQLEVSDLELKRQGKSYTIDTIKTLQKDSRFIGAEFNFILGADALTEIFTWKNAEELLALCWFIVAPRKGFDIGKLSRRVKKRMKLIQMEPVNISSSEIRARIRKHVPFCYYVPEKVYSYLIKWQVYGNN